MYEQKKRNEQKTLVGMQTGTRKKTYGFIIDNFINYIAY